MKPLVLRRGGAMPGISLPGNASHQFSNDDEINDERRRKQRILADVEDATPCQGKGFLFRLAGSTRRCRTLTRWSGGLP